MKSAQEILHLTDAQLAQIDGLIFDCDGTLADSMPPHYEAWAKIARDHGFDFDEDRFYSLGGWPTAKVARLLIDEIGGALDPEQISEMKEALFVERLHTVKPITPMVELVRSLHGVKPMAVATGGVPTLCRAILEHIGLLECFDAIVTSLDVEHGKPAPDVFLEAARRLGVEPTRCLAYEDAEPGIVSARAAGMRVIDVREFYQPERISSRKT